MSAHFSLNVPLAWDSASGSHRAHLSTFRCTLPDHGHFDTEAGFVCHDYPWELEVQQFLRNLHPPVPTPDTVMVGYDEVGLAAVLSMSVADLDRYGFIQALGVADRVSRNGFAGEALAQVPRVMERYGISSDYTVQARIDPRNYAAQVAFDRAGYAMAWTDYTFETWAKAF